MSKKHKVRTHSWINGILHTLEHFFESEEEAMMFADNTPAHSVKVYNHEGEVLTSRSLDVIPNQINVRSSYSGLEETYA